MIKNRLSILLAERGLKVTRVAKDTGISRNTITSTAQNDTEMIRLETVNALCKYLNVTPSEFFEYEPLDINFSIEVVSFPFKLGSIDGRRMLEGTEIDADLFMDIDWGHRKQSIDLSCQLATGFTIAEKRTALEEQIGKTISLKIEFDEDEEKETFVNEIYSRINASFHKDIYNLLYNVVKDGITKKVTANIDYFIKEHLNNDEYPPFGDQMRDSFFESDLDYFKNNIKVEIISDVFKPF